MQTELQLVLASASPRRRELLEQIGIHFLVQTADVDETPLAGESAVALVERLAANKAETVRNRRKAAGETDLPVLGSDTLGILDGELLVKPDDYADAQQMLRKMSGRQHEILTAVALATHEGIRVAVSRSVVRFRSVSDEEILAYWRTGEPHDKAGAYAIQGRGAIFVEKLEGSYSGVMGLPLFETAQLLTAAGIAVL
ncbi:MAG TPA: nucleoside triphosphate pyrophosphatase [Candidatus Thiothrix moscowensis]|uniref:Maf family protein n=1 Tax=unclassified Thiothrix TaxID=2636184 RepID=UPI0025CBEFC8|nr:MULTISPECIES: nucleoside triphosphate pyrophosphatase [unclassified Thiothrix]HRJ53566.1 nucleoside triphosphate pyrophosphatase [Candidatus Thiothrix moscowensis]HRJ93626.1 nucleoside triphosphate pyrophosphatase [Candidatus Thiothrix moscowensis]